MIKELFARPGGGGLTAMLSVLAMLVAVPAIPAAAQERFSGLTGTVTDASGAVLPGVTVTITNKETGKVVQPP